MRRLLSMRNRRIRLVAGRASERDVNTEGLTCVWTGPFTGAVRNLALLLIVVLAAAISARADSKTIARCGEGFLEEVNGYRVLHVAGEPYEMGYQQGASCATTSATTSGFCSTSRPRR